MQMKFSDSFAKKSEIAERLCQWFDVWDKSGKPEVGCYLDNYGKDKTLKEWMVSKDWI